MSLCVNIVYAFYLLCKHMIKKKSKEAFIAFKEALKFKFAFLPLNRLHYKCCHMLMYTRAHTFNFDIGSL